LKARRVLWKWIRRLRSLWLTHSVPLCNPEVESRVRRTTSEDDTQMIIQSLLSTYVFTYSPHMVSPILEYESTLPQDKSSLPWPTTSSLTLGTVVVPFSASSPTGGVLLVLSLFS
jgi:hypothetical protein